MIETNISIIMSVYNKEIPQYLDKSIKSIWDAQIMKPDEIILIEDGPLSDELENIIKKWKEKIKDKMKIIKFHKNMGLGIAMNTALKHAKNNIIARMDSDDIALPARLLKQIDTMNKKNCDVCSTWVAEFKNDENKTYAIKKVPINNNEIRKYAKRRNPINHPAVMFRKEAILNAGGYQNMPYFEDYYLWIRVIKMGYEIYNMPEVLLKMRSGINMITRRSGANYIKYEMEFIQSAYRIGYFNIIDYIINIIIRIPIRILPKKYIKEIYNKKLRDNKI